jgi:hypothetical protein
MEGHLYPPQPLPSAERDPEQHRAHVPEGMLDPAERWMPAERFDQRVMHEILR